MAKGDPHFRLRIPADMKVRIERAAAESGRSINSEILVRLQQSLDGAFLDMSSEGFDALIKRLEASVIANENLFMQRRDTLNDLERRLMGDNDRELADALEELRKELHKTDNDAPDTELGEPSRKSQLR